MLHESYANSDLNLTANRCFERNGSWFSQVSKEFSNTSCMLTGRRFRFCNSNCIRWWKRAYSNNCLLWRYSPMLIARRLPVDKRKHYGRMWRNKIKLRFRSSQTSWSCPFRAKTAIASLTCTKKLNVSKLFFRSIFIEARIAFASGESKLNSDELLWSSTSFGKGHFFENSRTEAIGKLVFFSFPSMTKDGSFSFWG